MGRGRRARHRRNRARTHHAATAAACVERRADRVAVEVTLKALELARAYDGPLRGAPEPALLFAAYLVPEAGEPQLLARALERVPCRGGCPQTVALERTALRAAAPREQAERLLLVMLALEEDAGTDVADLYAALERPEQFTIFPPGPRVPEAVTLEDLLRVAPAEPPRAEPVCVLRRGVDLGELRRDDWVGAALLRVRPARGAAARLWRVPLVAADGRNDWTAVLRVLAR
ncbi:MAG: hypothetical protein JXB32_19350 [Deltaproteobacteria bacterium]|nr:hypothetical protein [Deltaproteobacteria bacterium]